jgi:hypothetical protein
MTVNPSRSTRVAGWFLTVIVTVIFAFMLYCSAAKLLSKTPSDKAKAVMALRLEVQAFDRALAYAGDHFDPQLDAADLQLKWGPKMDAYGDKLLGYGASKERLDKLLRHPPPYANDPKMGEYYKNVAAELDKMADSLVVPP